MNGLGVPIVNSLDSLVKVDLLKLLIEQVTCPYLSKMSRDCVLIDAEGIYLTIPFNT